MNTWRKCSPIVLCLCISSYALPVGAGDAGANKSELTDTQMGKTFGGAGQIDAMLADVHPGETAANAVVINRAASAQAEYSLDVLNSAGDVLETLDSGVLAVGEAKLISGSSTVVGPLTSDHVVRARVWLTDRPAYEAIDISIP